MEKFFDLNRDLLLTHELTLDHILNPVVKVLDMRRTPALVFHIFK